MKEQVKGIIKRFGEYCNGLSHHNCEGLKFDQDCEDVTERIIKLFPELK